MALDAEVIVVGAGPAGSAAALHLAERGHDVLLLDRASFPRDKACGEGLMPHGVGALARLGIVLEGARLGGIAYYAGGNSAVGRFPEGSYGIGVARTTLDARLIDEASRHPRVHVRTGVRATGMSGTPGAMTIASDAGPLRARAIVGADGLGSPVRAWAGLDRPIAKPRRFGLRVHVAVAPRRVPDVVEVHAGPEAELYVTPLLPTAGGLGRLNIAALVGKAGTRKLKGDPDTELRRLIGACPSLALGEIEVLGPARTWGPLRRSARAVVADGVVLVGDAAGFVDAVTGEGMSLGLVSAEIAGDVLSSGLRNDRLQRRDLRPYSVRRRRMARDVTWLTEAVLFGLRRPALAARVVGNLAREPEVFDRVLAVAVGRAPLWSLGLVGLCRLLRPS
jgi:2-polyprenyl-6-methoxyphenol hydroxylase-like FAD-dependent oxidoreductase